MAIPRTRQGFQTHLFERYHRRQAELDTAIGDMFVYGTSMTRVGEVVATLTGQKPSPSTVSRVFHSLEDEFETWKTRPLAAHYRYIFLDGTYFTVIYDHEGQKMPIVAAVGIRWTGEREVVAFRVGERENQTAWEDLLQDLRDRGVQHVELFITDGGQAMLNALAVKFSPTPGFPGAARHCAACLECREAFGLSDLASWAPSSALQLLRQEHRGRA